MKKITSKHTKVQLNRQFQIRWFKYKQTVAYINNISADK